MLAARRKAKTIFELMDDSREADADPAEAEADSEGKGDKGEDEDETDARATMAACQTGERPVCEVGESGMAGFGRIAKAANEQEQRELGML